MDRFGTATAVQLPKVMKREVKVLDATQLAAFIEGVRAAGLHEFVMLAEGFQQSRAKETAVAREVCQE